MKSFLVLFLISILSLNVYADISDIEIIEKSTNPLDYLRVRPGSTIQEIDDKTMRTVMKITGWD